MLPFVVAEKLGERLSVVRSWPNSELEEWNAFLAVKRQQNELQALQQKQRMNRGSRRH
jgi:hypothetical protein